jgi:uncharacterized membrane protein YGL010W
LNNAPLVTVAHDTWGIWGHWREREALASVARSALLYLELPMPSPFRPAIDLLAQYASYHRDRRNIVTHFAGVPLIVLAIGVVLARPTWPLAGWMLTPAWLLCALSSAWYLTRGSWGIGLATVLVNVGLIYAGQQISQLSATTSTWLLWGAGTFVVGWIIQFIGHYYEGRKPAFADDIVGLLVGPMFVVLELLALLGLFKGLTDEIARRVGPTMVRDLAQPLAH